MSYYIRLVTALLISPAAGIYIVGVVALIPGLQALLHAGSDWSSIGRWLLVNQVLLFTSPLYFFMLITASPIILVGRRIWGHKFLINFLSVIASVLLVTFTVWLSTRAEKFPEPLIIVLGVPLYCLAHCTVFHYVAGSRPESE